MITNKVKIQSVTNTKSVTNTQLAVAILAAFAAGGLAFAASPRGGAEVPACTVESVDFLESCQRGNKFRTAHYVCSDGSSGQLAGNACRSTSKLQRAVDRACSRKQCAVEPAAGNEPQTSAPVAEAIPVSDQCALQDIHYSRPCGRNRFAGVQFTCSDGHAEEPAAVDCSSTNALQNAAIVACSQRNCRARINNVSSPTNGGEPLAGTPNLDIGDVSFHSDRREVSIFIKNKGTGSSEALTDEDEGIILEWRDGNAEKLQTSAYGLDALGVNEEKIYTFSYPQQGILHQLSIEVDGKSKVVELNEEDNRGSYKIPVEYSGDPALFFASEEIDFQNDGAKLSVGVKISNSGTGIANVSSNVYTLEFLDENQTPLNTIELNLSSELIPGDTKVYSTTLERPEGARFVRAMIKSAYMGGGSRTITSPLP